MSRASSYSYRIRKEISGRGVPREWFAQNDRYGWYVSLRIFLPFLSVFLLALRHSAVSPLAHPSNPLAVR